ncbi:MAG: hypothetical protein QOF69_2934, partial [Solirubrobacteraceae bacterium]|nr:hypothetical protein [Solirubrobacteraceae bacterium]
LFRARRFRPPGFQPLRSRNPRRGAACALDQPVTFTHGNSRSALKSLRAEGIADKELSVLLATDRVIPVAHDTTFEALRDVSPMLASRSGLSTAESSLVDVAAKIADTVLVDAVLV